MYILAGSTKWHAVNKPIFQLGTLLFPEFKLGNIVVISNENIPQYFGICL